MFVEHAEKTYCPFQFGAVDMSGYCLTTGCAAWVRHSTCETFGTCSLLNVEAARDLLKTIIINK